MRDSATPVITLFSSPGIVLARDTYDHEVGLACFGIPSWPPISYLEILTYIPELYQELSDLPLVDY